MGDMTICIFHKLKYQKKRIKRFRHYKSLVITYCVHISIAGQRHCAPEQFPHTSALQCGSLLNGLKLKHLQFAFDIGVTGLEELKLNTDAKLLPKTSGELFTAEVGLGTVVNKILAIFYHTINGLDLGHVLKMTLTLF